MDGQPETEISLTHVFAILRENKRVILIAVLLSTASALGWALIRTPQYSWQACEAIGLIGRNSLGEPIHAATTRNTIAQIRDGYLPAALVRFDGGGGNKRTVEAA